MSKASSSVYPSSAAAPHLQESKPLGLKNNTVKDTFITTALKFNQAGGPNKASHSATTAMLQVSFRHSDKRSRDHMIVVDYNLLGFKAFHQAETHTSRSTPVSETASQILYLYR